MYEPITGKDFEHFESLRSNYILNMETYSEEKKSGGLQNYIKTSDGKCTKQAMHNYIFVDKPREIFTWEQLLETYYDKPNVNITNISMFKEYYSNVQLLNNNTVKHKTRYLNSKNDYYVYGNVFLTRVKNALYITNSTRDMEYKDSQRTHNLFVTFLNLFDHYSDIYDYSLLEIECRSGKNKMSSGEKAVTMFLDKICIKYDFTYFYKYRPDFCKNQKKLEYDFYCCLTYKKRIFHFVIEYDGDQHYKNVKIWDEHNLCHMRDILKQYYLFQMNIHLLRIRTCDNIKLSIVNFINKILISTKYVAVNKIEPIKELFIGTTEHPGLKDFYVFHKLIFESGKAPNPDKTNNLPKITNKKNLLVDRIDKCKKINASPNSSPNSLSNSSPKIFVHASPKKILIDSYHFNNMKDRSNCDLYYYILPDDARSKKNRSHNTFLEEFLKDIHIYNEIIMLGVDINENQIIQDNDLMNKFQKLDDRIEIKRLCKNYEMNKRKLVSNYKRSLKEKPKSKKSLSKERPVRKNEQKSDALEIKKQSPSKALSMSNNKQICESLFVSSTIPIKKNVVVENQELNNIYVQGKRYELLCDASGKMRMVCLET